MSEQAAEFVRQATEALQGGDAARALELATQALASDPGNSEALVLKGIALAQTGQPAAATEAFRGAIAADPSNPKAYYNLATHYYQQGEKNQALAMAQEALRADPGHAAARELVSLIEGEQAPPTAAAPPETPYGTPYSAPEYRQGYDQPAHAIQFVGNLGPKWLNLGWGLVAASAAVFVISWIMVGPQVMEQIQAAMKDPQAAQAMRNNVGNLGLSIVSWIIQIGTLVWMVLDIADRRGNWLWILPFAICCCCGMQWLVMPIYFLNGRK